MSVKKVHRWSEITSPCPFCGNVEDGKFEFNYIAIQGGQFTGNFACKVCGCEGPDGDFGSKAQAYNSAAKKWNNRFYSQPGRPSDLIVLGNRFEEKTAPSIPDEVEERSRYVSDMLAAAWLGTPDPDVRKNIDNCFGVLVHGAKKKRGLPPESPVEHISHAFEHSNASSVEYLEDESGLPHMCHAGVRLLKAFGRIIGLD